MLEIVGLILAHCLITSFYIYIESLLDTKECEKIPEVDSPGPLINPKLRIDKVRKVSKLFREVLSPGWILGDKDILGSTVRNFENTLKFWV